MNGIDAVKTFFGGNHPLFSLMGVRVERFDAGHAELVMPYSDILADHRGALHRGALVTLLDTTCGVAIFSAQSSRRQIATIDLRVDYLRPIPPGVGVRADVTCVAMNETVAYVTGRGLADDSGELLATLAGTFAIDTLGPAFGRAQKRSDA